MSGGYGTPIQKHCDYCGEPLDELNQMVNPIHTMNKQWKYVCSECFQDTLNERYK
jgi:hypothetical protein